MKTLYLDCGMGAAGDMLTAALLELLPDPDGFIERLNGLGIPNVTYIAEPSIKCGIKGTHISVRISGAEEDAHHAHHHHHSTLHHIEHIIRQMDVSARVKQDIQAVYSLIAEAESHVHGVPVSEIHFHEVGTMDAIADVTAVCLLMETLSPEQVIVSPVHVGSGQIQCAHGILPVPAPATAYILQNVPVYGGSLQGELCTPTGAALLKYFATAFGDMPVMKIGAIGYGMGKKAFSVANCIRAMLGNTQEAGDTVLELSCNLDDMTPEAIGFSMERLLEGGALDVYTVPIGMKKSRPGTMLCVLCRVCDRESILRLLFRQTTTLGVRETALQRHVLKREVLTVETPFGAIRRKDASGYGVVRSKYEYEDLARIAKAQNLSINELENSVRNAAACKNGLPGCDF